MAGVEIIVTISVSYAGFTTRSSNLFVVFPHYRDLFTISPGGSLDISTLFKDYDIKIIPPF